jgi:hypothetical protein
VKRVLERASATSKIQEALASRDTHVLGANFAYFLFDRRGKLLVTNQFITHQKRIVVALGKTNSHEEETLTYTEALQEFLDKRPFFGPGPIDH